MTSMCRLIQVVFGLFLVIGFGVAFGQEPDFVQVVDATWPNLIQKFIPFMVASMVALRGISELMFLISEKTANKQDDTVASYLSKVTAMLGKVCAWFGVGMPSTLVMAKAEAQAVKELSSDGSKSNGAGGQSSGPSV